jgi:hypothetical protein
MNFLLLTYNVLSTLKAEDTSQTTSLKDAVIGLLTVLAVLVINWITRKLQKRIDDQKLANANNKADSADQKALAATQVAGLANQTAHANSDLLTQLQSQSSAKTRSLGRWKWRSMKTRKSAKRPG